MRISSPIHRCRAPKKTLNGFGGLWGLGLEIIRKPQIGLHARTLLTQKAAGSLRLWQAPKPRIVEHQSFKARTSQAQVWSFCFVATTGKNYVLHMATK